MRVDEVARFKLGEPSRIRRLNGSWYRCPNDDGSTPHLLDERVLCATCTARLVGDAGPPTAGRKFDAGKLRYDLVDAFALAWLVSTLTYGVAKYAAYNYRNFTKEELREKYYAGMMRHLEAFRMGQDDDPESGIPHVALMMFGAMVLTETFAPRDLNVVIDRTAEAIRRLRERQAAGK